jgi:phospholipase C
MVTFDEHGGTYDHVSPPPVLPPDPAAPAGQLGFAFDRSGVRVPAIAISAWIPERTVINAEYRHTSVIRTIRERWQLGTPLTARDAAARDISPVLSLDTPRPPEDWPEVFPRPVPPFDPAQISPDARLRALPKAAFFAVLELAKQRTDHLAGAPEYQQDVDICHADAVTLIVDAFGHMFPGLRSQ